MTKRRTFRIVMDGDQKQPDDAQQKRRLRIQMGLLEMLDGSLMKFGEVKMPYRHFEELFHMSNGKQILREMYGIALGNKPSRERTRELRKHTLLVGSKGTLLQGVAKVLLQCYPPSSNGEVDFDRPPRQPWANTPDNNKVVEQGVSKTNQAVKDAIRGIAPNERLGRN
jgi:hypothetical protein